MAENLYTALGSDRYNYTELRQWRYFDKVISQLKLFVWAFKNANAEVNICVARLAIPAILRNLLTNNKVIVVWHYYDDNDGKSKLLKNYYHGLANLSTWIPKKKLCFIVVAPYWEKFFKDYFEIKNVLLFPNFFDPTLYTKFEKTVKKKQIHLGQESFKNSRELFIIAHQLKELGYSCYLSTNNSSKAAMSIDFEVKYFDNFQNYLLEMACSEYTLAMPFINEGWNRVAHESLLVGTQVIGFNKGGLGDLLIGANAFLVDQKYKDNVLYEFERKTSKDLPKNIVEQTIAIIVSQEQKTINHAFLQKFEPMKIGNSLITIADWCRKK